MLQDDREVLTGKWAWVTFNGGSFQVAIQGQGLQFTGLLAGQGKKVQLRFDPSDDGVYECRDTAGARIFVDGEQLVLQRQAPDGSWSRETLASRCPHAATRIYFKSFASRVTGRSRPPDVNRATSSASVSRTAQPWATDDDLVRAASEPSFNLRAATGAEGADKESQKVLGNNALNLQMSASTAASLAKQSSKDSPKQSWRDAPQHVACTPALSPTAAEFPALCEGQQVVIVGLMGQQQAHNGEVGTVARLQTEGGKFDIVLQGPALAAVEIQGPEHVIPAASNTTPSLLAGATVAIRGLKNQAELNGYLARIVECHEKINRFDVRTITNDDLFRVKGENLVPVDAAYASLSAATQEASRKLHWEEILNGNACRPSVESIGSGGCGSGDDMEPFFQIGSDVLLVGLKKDVDLNGTTAEVLSGDRDRGMYEIRLRPCGRVKSVASHYVRLVDCPAGMVAESGPDAQGLADESVASI